MNVSIYSGLLAVRNQNQIKFALCQKKQKCPRYTGCLSVYLSPFCHRVNLLSADNGKLNGKMANGKSVYLNFRVYLDVGV